MKTLIFTSSDKILIMCLLVFSQNLLLNAQILPDGTLDNKELENMELVVEEGINKLYIKETKEYFYVSVKTEEIYVASLCVCNGSSISVLHASAALGKLNYEKSEDNIWNTNESFVWEMREKGFSPEEIDKRKEYLDKNGWVASTMEMGKIGETEFVISKEWLSEKPRFAIGLMPASLPENTFSLPIKNSLACGNHSLVSGEPKSNYSFTPIHWVILE
ncbi:hypothetical protein [Winogradskyella pulchriflava]|uniref:Uncharacterized protein n=1 Tax=Winogradskyella pulchriflava TaxID=1110688 RepID=A0ABV6QC28_9FLAO